MKDFLNDKRNHFWLLLFVAVLLRVPYPKADPPMNLSWSGGYYADEGFWTHDARNQIVFGDFCDDEWHDRFVSPIVYLVVKVVFSLFGSGIGQARIWAHLFSYLGILLLFLSVYRKSDAIYSWVLLSVCSLFIAYQRIAILETAAVLGCALLVFSFGKTIQSNAAGWSVVTGMAVCLTYVSKGTQVFLFPVIFLADLWIWKLSRRTWKVIFFQILGICLIAVPFLLVIYLPNESLLNQYHHYYASQHGSTLKSYLTNILTTPFLIYFNRIPFIFCLCWCALAEIFVPYYQKKSDSMEKFYAIWIATGLIFFLPLGYRPLRYFIPLLVPIILLAANRLTSFEKYADPTRSISTYKIYLIKAWLCIPVIANLMPLVDYYCMDSQILGIASLPGFSLSGAWIVVLFGLSCAILYPVRINNLSRYFLLLIAVFHGAITLNHYSNRTYDVLKTSKDLALILPAHAVVAGQWAPELMLETDCRAIPLWKDFVNDDDPFKKYGITHLLSWQYPLGDELALQKEWFPIRMDEAELIKTYRIKNTPVLLWKIRQ